MYIIDAQTAETFQKNLNFRNEPRAKRAVIGIIVLSRADSTIFFEKKLRPTDKPKRAEKRQKMVAKRETSIKNTIKEYMFGFGLHKKNRRKLALIDCADASVSETSHFPATLGGSNDPLKTGFPFPFLEVSETKGGKLLLTPTDPTADVKINGTKISEPVELSGAATMQLGERLFYLSDDPKTIEKARNMDVSKWLVFYAETGRIEDEVPFARLKQSVLGRGLSGAGIAICPKGFELGFMFSSVFGDGSDSDATVPILSENSEAITCPLCWLKFDVGDAMSIAVHESLRGDPVLGQDEMLRFLPTSFTEDGVAIDPAGMPAPDVACPHCRRKLPPNYLELDRRIFSIVGAPSAGKSYYLSALISMLQGSLYKNFGIVLKDLDPSGNMLLTQMKNSLFSAKRPEDAILAKTALEGKMYERYPRFGKIVALPKPMTYSLSRDGAEGTSIIFYDNAGEHFEPGLDIEESPGAMHVASSSGIFFLFDPAANRNFKAALGDYPDPQLSIDGRLDQQDTILSEMEIRIKRILAIEPLKKIDTPLAILIGKCDMWKHLLKTPLAEPISDGKLDLAAVDSNSGILRDFLAEIDPTIPASAESISSNIRYFAVSALGHSPQMLLDGECAGKIAPIPSKIKPIDVEIPAIWLLSQSTKLIPTK